VPREEPETQTPTQRTEIELADYHRLADYFLEDLLRKLEQRQEEKGDLDAEYSVRYCPIVRAVHRY
jgi:frataxin